MQLPSMCVSGRIVSSRVAIMMVMGLASVLFTYFGVNYLPGLHSYQ